MKKYFCSIQKQLLKQLDFRSKKINIFKYIYSIFIILGRFKETY